MKEVEGEDDAVVERSDDGEMMPVGWTTGIENGADGKGERERIDGDEAVD